MAALRLYPARNGTKFGSLGIAVILATYGGGFCDFPQNYPQIWDASRQILKSQSLQSVDCV